MRKSIQFRSEEISEVAIIGAGLIGASWAAYFSHHGLRVNVYDPNETLQPSFFKVAKKALTDLQKLTPRETCNIGKIVFCDSVAKALENCDYVQENGPEDIKLKQALIQNIDSLLAQDVIIGSSTSSLLCSDIQIQCKYPERVIVAHPFNPPHLIPLVELGAGESTSPEAMDAAYTFFSRIRKAPIKIKKEAVGHVANRLTSALWREAVHLVAEGIASVADVDRAICYGPGLRWAVNGPHMLYHLGGGEGGITAYLEHLGPTQEARWHTLGMLTLDLETCNKLIRGIAESARNKSFDDLVNERDSSLLALLQALPHVQTGQE